jgi:hypothetical protein
VLEVRHPEDERLHEAQHARDVAVIALIDAFRVYDYISVHQGTAQSWPDGCHDDASLFQGVKFVYRLKYERAGLGFRAAKENSRYRKFGSTDIGLAMLSA